MATVVSNVGQVVRLNRDGMEIEYRVEAVDNYGNTLRASAKHSDPELIQALGLWDDVRNLSRLSEIDAEIRRLSNAALL